MSYFSGRLYVSMQSQFLGSETSIGEFSNKESEDMEFSYSFKPLEFEVEQVAGEETPFARSGHRIVCDEDNLYLFGGYNPSRPTVVQEDEETNTQGRSHHSLFPDLWKYNFAGMKWSKLPVKNVPVALVSNAVVLSGKILMVYGGTGLRIHTSKSNKLHVCNLAGPNLDFVTVEAIGQLPQPLYGQAAFLKDHFFYTIGGKNGFQYFMDIHRLDLRSNKWEEVYMCKGLKNEPAGRYRHELAVVEDRVYIVGGCTKYIADDFEKMYYFDLIKREWHSVCTYRDCEFNHPLPRQLQSVVNIPGTSSFIMVGGVCGNVLDDAWRLDIPSMRWSRICSLSLCKPVYFHSSCVTPSGKMFVFGGITKSGNALERVSDIQSAWLGIPKLKDICWDALADYGLLHDIISNPDNFRLPAEFANKVML